jgi:hypothetical protein
MIRDKTKEMVKEAEDMFAAEPSHFSRDYAKYGMLQILIDNVLEDCMNAVRNTDLRSITVTTYDKENYDALRNKFVNAIKESHGYRTRQ